MATPVKETPVDKTATRTSTSISGPAYKVTVGGTARGKPRRYTISTTSKKTVIEEYRVLPRYLKPKTGSCHDSCKHANDEWMGLKNTRRLGTNKQYTMTTSRYLKPSTGSCHDSCKHGKNEITELKTTRSLASRKRSVTKSNGVKRTVVSVERKKITATKPKPPQDSKIRKTGNELKIHSSVKTKPMTVKPSSSTLKNKKVTKSTRVSPRKDQHMMTKTKLRQLIADKIQEMTLQEAETAEVGVEETIDQLPETITTESTIVQSSEEVLNEEPSSEEVLNEESASEEVLNEEPASEEVLNEESSSEEVLNKELASEEVVNEESSSGSSQSSSKEQVSESGSEHADDEVCEEELLVEEFEYDEEGYILEEDDDETENDGEKSRRDRVVKSEEKDGPRKVRFMRGKVLEVDGEDGPRRLKFKEGTVLEGDEEEESEKVNLKHQEVGKKEAKELLNSVIEVTASKLVEDKKTKVGALVGAFETVISQQDETPGTPSEK